MERVRLRKREQWGWITPAAAFALVFGATSYLLAPKAPSKDVITEEWTKRTTDHDYSGCSQARANGHENIASWEPSYRIEMDGDGDGLACEQLA